jgi:hypothetical protein
MAANVLNYHDDGANRQAQAALAMFQYLMGDGIEESWDDHCRSYMADVRVARWENCREQGYVLMLNTKDGRRQLNIAFFEHRNSDNICAVKWEQWTMNSPTIDTANFGEDYTNKFDTTFDVPYCEVMQMAKWMKNEFVTFWKETSKTVDN